MTTPLLLELFGAFAGACFALWLASQSLPSPRIAWLASLAPLRPAALAYLQKPGLMGSLGLLVLRLSIGVMMIHHGQEKLADPESFAAAYLVPLHMPVPLFMAHVAGLSEILGSWFVILGFLTPIGALALVGTMTVAGYHHILTSGFNIYLLELVVLYLGGSLAILLNGPGRYSIDSGIVSGLLDSDSHEATPFIADPAYGEPAPVVVRAEANASLASRGTRRG